MKVFALIGLFFASLALAETASRESTAQVTAKRKGSDAFIQLAPPAGTHLNYEGPWKLTIAEQTLGMETFNKSTNSFLVPLKDQSTGKPQEFKLAYFLCSDDNVWCKRIEAQGEVK